MLSKKFCFKPTLFFDVMRRFCPVWLFATIAMLLAIPCYIWRLFLDYAGDVHGSMQVIASIGSYDSQLGLQINDFLLELATAAPIITMVYAVVPAAVLLSYLYQSRSALGVHALPITRTTLFCTHYVAGLAMLLLPLVIVSLITLPMLLSVGAFWPQAWGVLFASFAGSYCFFFSFAVFCGMFTGQLWGMPLFYAIFNAIAPITFWVFAILAQAYLYGFSVSGAGTELIEWLTPIWKLKDSLWCQSINATGEFTFYGLGILGGYALVGIGFALAALLLFQQRHLERAGEIVTVNIMRPVFHVCVSLYGGFLIMMLCCQLFDISTLGGMLLYLALGVLVGFAAGKMLLEKTIAILSLRSLAQYGVTLCVASLIFLGFYSDLLGYQGYLPEVEDVKQVEVSVSIYADQVSFSQSVLTATTDTQISQLVTVHALLIEEYEAKKAERTITETASTTTAVIIEAGEAADGAVLTDGGYVYSDRYTYFEITYTLENGRKVTREYLIYISQAEIARAGSAVSALEAYIASFDPVLLLLADKAQLTVDMNDADYTKSLYGTAGSSASTAVLDALITDLQAQGTKLSLLQKDYSAARTASLYINEVRRDANNKHEVYYNYYARADVYPGTALEAYFLENASDY